MTSPFGWKLHALWRDRLECSARANAALRVIASRPSLVEMRAWAAGAVVILAGCSGQVAAPIPDASDVDASDAAAVDAADSGIDCAELAAQLDALIADAKTCCPICHEQQCGTVVQGVCCPFSVTGQPSQKLLDAIAQYRTECMKVCNGACAVSPNPGTCVPKDPANPSGSGVCQ